MAYKAVLFDLDGTLVHTPFGYVREVVGKALQELGTSSSDAHIRRFWFYPGRDGTIKNYFCVEPDAFWPLLRKYDTPEARMQAARPYDDVHVLGELKRMGYKTGIVTGAPENIMFHEVEMLGLDNFDVVIRAQQSSGIRPKPDPQGAYRCLEELHAKPPEALLVGNGPEDILAAQAAGMLDIHIDRGEHSLDGVQPSVSIKSLYELHPLLQPSNAP